VITRDEPDRIQSAIGVAANRTCKSRALRDIYHRILPASMGHQNSNTTFVIRKKACLTPSATQPIGLAPSVAYCARSTGIGQSGVWIRNPHAVVSFMLWTAALLDTIRRKLPWRSGFASFARSRRLEQPAP